MSTTFYPFHRWIESSSTTDTVVLAFGGWWDASTTTAEIPTWYPIHTKFGKIIRAC